MLGGPVVITPPPAPCFVIEDMSCGGAQTATLRWSSWLPDWVRERTRILVGKWPRGRWSMAEIASRTAGVAPVVRDTPTGVTRWVLSYGAPRKGVQGRDHAVILHGCDTRQAAAMSPLKGATFHGVSDAVLAANGDWVRQSGNTIGRVVRPPICTRGWSPGAIMAHRSDPGGPITVLFRSRLTEAKGARVLVPMLAADPEIRLIVQAGEDTEHCDDVRQWQRDAVARIQAEAVRGGVDDRLSIVGFTPEVNPDSLAGTSAGVLLLPTESEGYGLVVAEALAMGIPVAATAVGGVPEAVSRTGRAVLFPWSADVAVLAKRAAEAVRQAAALGRAKPAIDEWGAENLSALLDVCGAHLCPGGDHAEVTVAVRVHVGARMDWLDACMGSIAGQSFRRFRTLLCIDGLRADSERIAARYGVPFVCTDQAPKPANMSLSFRLGAEACGTEYFKPLDYDDRLAVDYLTNAMAEMRSRTLDLYACLMRTADESGRVGAVARWPQDTPLDVLDSGDKLLNPIPHLSVLLRTQALLAAGNYLPTAPDPGDDDCDVWIRLRRAGARMWRDSRAMVAYRLSAGQASRRKVGDADVHTPARVTAAARPLRIAYAALTYAPSLAGSEIYAREIARRLAKRGHSVCVVTATHPTRMGFAIADEDGVRVERGVKESDVAARLRSFHPNVVVTQLSWSDAVTRQANNLGLPVVGIVHAPVGMNHFRRCMDKVAHIVFNAEASTSMADPERQHSFLRPPVDPARVASIHDRAGGAITLINLAEAKGGTALAAISPRSPGRRFIGVRGGYGVQVVAPRSNVEYLKPTDAIEAVFSRTRVLLMPSTSESYGLAAVEAQANGIPVVATDLPSLRDSLGEGAIYVPAWTPDTTGDWVDAIASLDDADRYADLSAKALANAERQAAAFRREFDEFEALLMQVAK